MALNGDSTIYDLVATQVLDELSHTELVVYLRILAAADRFPGITRMPIRNAHLHRDARTAGRALAGLRKRGIIRVRYGSFQDGGSGGRTVEVLP